MSKSEQNVPKAPDGMADISAITMQSFDAMSRAFSTWLRDANRLQAGAIRFLNDRFNKDLQMMTQFAACKRPEEVFELQTKLISELMSDYMTEGTKVLELFGDTVKGEVEEFSKTLSAKH